MGEALDPECLLKVKVLIRLALMAPFLLEGFGPPEDVWLPCPSFVAPCVPEKGECNPNGLFVEYCWIAGVT